ncbi:MAG TPA: gamma-glutamyltransferase [Bryobacteraceae bacterium]|nr:gamma-glutamyltransferase [Bryobacteraceae bacterium]
MQSSRTLIVAMATVLTLPWITANAQGRNYGRSMVITQKGIVATSHALASQAGVQILARGGSAADAAIAANAVLAVMEPDMCGLGGDLFVLYRQASTGKLTGLNASGPAPRALTPDFLRSSNIATMPVRGIHSVTVPGAVDGWAKMHARFGKLPWKDLFQAAIAYAEQGFPITEVIQEAWRDAPVVQKLRENAESTRVFLPGSKAPEVAQIFRNPDMAKAFRLVAEQGRDAFYQGDIAKAILRTSEKLGGTMTAADLRGFSSEWVEPISTDYHGWRVYELPPNGQGMAALQMLNLMETAPPTGDTPLNGVEMHKRIESMKLAYADLVRYNADPRSNPVPLAGLLSKEYARKRASLIDPAVANCNVAAGEAMRSDTIYLSVVDKEGNMASWIQSVADQFGSGVTVEGMGFVLHNRGWGFNLDPTHPGVLAGGKRPFHTIIPGFLERGDEQISFGIMGGLNQPLAHAQFVSNIVDYGMNIQAALEAPRFTKRAVGGCDVSIESRVPLQVLQQLSERGHEIRIRREYTQEMGRGQAILRNAKTGVNYAASDPRADGAAHPEPITIAGSK